MRRFTYRGSEGLILLAGLLAAGGAFAFTGCKQARVADPTGIEEYRAEAKLASVASGDGTGSLWTGTGQHSNLFRDMKARYVNDVVTIQVSESTQATASADASASRSASMSNGIDSLVGLQGRIKELPSLVSGEGETKFDGQGSTSRATKIQTTMTARVTDVLPNGYLVVEGRREIRVNNENQSIVLAGIVRPNDIDKNNVVASSAVAQMSMRVEGKGSVSQPLKPGWLYKILNGVLPF
ncbi:MAG: flagellar basal body L-ring protein FlgH [Acidobacteriota bacterium]|jgi:flagellar L-ring protein precursor FlgH|nr:flagellar basal body L-ring protein FlgH [Acidobacteriota bacterium]